MPFTVVTPQLGIPVGLFELAAYLIFVRLAVRRGILTSETGVVLLGVYLFCLLTAATTAVGRMNPQDPAFSAAIVHRYVIIPLTAQATLILAAAWLFGNSRYFLWAPFASLAALGFWLTARMPHIEDWCDFTKNTLSNCQLASLAFASGVDDSGLMATVYPGAQPVRESLPILRRDHLSTFADNKIDWLGRPASSVFPLVSAARQPGAITSTYPLESGLMVSDGPIRRAESGTPKSWYFSTSKSGSWDWGENCRADCRAELPRLIRLGLSPGLDL